MNSPDKSQINLWGKWIKATAENEGYSNDCYRYSVPEKVWNAVWNGNWPDDEDTIRLILEKYLNIETAKTRGYFELVISLRQQAEAALKAAKRTNADRQQVKIEAEIEEAVNTIRGLGRKSSSDNPTIKRGRIFPMG